MALFGPRNGTNNAVSSSAHLGVHGRVVGSFLSLLTAIAFFSISVWSSGDALVGGANRLQSACRNDFTVALAYGVFALLVLVVCIYGFRFMLLVNKIAVIAATRALPARHLRLRAATSTPATRAPSARTRRRDPRVLAVVHRRRADRDVQPGLLRRVPR